jgi:hypothetical protein
MRFFVINVNLSDDFVHCLPAAATSAVGANLPTMNLFVILADCHAGQLNYQSVRIAVEPNLSAE